MKRSPAAAMWLSLLWPGLGHCYLGQVSRGIVFALLAVGLIQFVNDGTEILVLLVLGLWLFAMLDAHRNACECNLRVESGQLPVDTLAQTGSKWWGLALVALGVVFLLYNFDVFDLNWLWDLWPIALILVGLRLILPPTAAKAREWPLSPPPPASGGTAEATPPAPGPDAVPPEAEGAPSEGERNERAEAS